MVVTGWGTNKIVAVAQSVVVFLLSMSQIRVESHLIVCTSVGDSDAHINSRLGCDYDVSWSEFEIWCIYKSEFKCCFTFWPMVSDIDSDDEVYLDFDLPAFTRSKLSRGRFGGVCQNKCRPMFSSLVESKSLKSMQANLRQSDVTGSRFMRALTPLREVVIEYKKISSAVSQVDLLKSETFQRALASLRQIIADVRTLDCNKFLKQLSHAMADVGSFSGAQNVPICNIEK